MTQTRLFLDTNVLVYAHDASSQHHDTSAALLSAIFAREFSGVIAEQNLFELYRILTNPIAMKNKPLTAEEAKALIETVYLGGVFQVVYLTQPILHQAFSLAVQRNIIVAGAINIGSRQVV
ncbi:type II toxin-antitoxin system VapC family toxin [Leptolyngbya sp. PCC 6406]|uniref:type II toxin-antitoxin system VapC family toxin n=1 Tax=Leptolyngbya sp. PCC 6406 TaxID=1173264 RepID=UPI0002AD05C1|nr:PIN domain-containing protein [Leptolyngbya sp. PCC 6406]